MLLKLRIMKTSEIKVTVKLKDVLDAPLMSAWEISLEDAELYGLVER